MYIVSYIGYYMFVIKYKDVFLEKFRWKKYMTVIFKIKNDSNINKDETQLLRIIQSS